LYDSLSPRCLGREVRWVPAEVGLERLVPQAGSIRPDEALA